MNKNDNKRKLLKSIAVGSGVVVAGKAIPESWSKPVIDSVMLPAHAITTNDNSGDGTDTTTTANPCEAGTYDIASCSIDQFSGKATLSAACRGITVSLSLFSINIAHKKIYADTDLNGVAQFDFDLLGNLAWTGFFEAPNGSKCENVWNG